MKANLSDFTCVLRFGKPEGIALVPRNRKEYQPCLKFWVLRSIAVKTSGRWIYTQVVGGFMLVHAMSDPFDGKMFARESFGDPQGFWQRGIRRSFNGIDAV